jgi:hypothetical protein
MKTANGIVVAAVCLAWALNGAPAAEQSPLSEVSSGRFTRIALCGYGDGHTSKGIPDEETLRKACDVGRDSFVVEVGGLAVTGLELTIKRSLKSAQEIHGPGAADLPCMAMVTVVLESGRSVQMFVMSTGELRSGVSRVMPENRKWLHELTSQICKLIE